MPEKIPEACSRYFVPLGSYSQSPPGGVWRPPPPHPANGGIWYHPIRVDEIWRHENYCYTYIITLIPIIIGKWWMPDGGEECKYRTKIVKTVFLTVIGSGAHKKWVSVIRNQCCHQHMPPGVGVGKISSTPTPVKTTDSDFAALRLKQGNYSRISNPSTVEASNAEQLCENNSSGHPRKYSIMARKSGQS